MQLQKNYVEAAVETTRLLNVRIYKSRVKRNKTLVKLIITVDQIFK